MSRPLTGPQARQIGGAVAYLLGWAYTGWYRSDWTPTADAGVALALLITALVDLVWGDGTALDEAAVRAAAARVVETHPSQDRSVVAAAIRSTP